MIHLIIKLILGIIIFLVIMAGCAFIASIISVIVTSSLWLLSLIIPGMNIEFLKVFIYLTILFTIVCGFFLDIIFYIQTDEEV